MLILVTGGAGFIGSALVRFLIGQTNHRVVVVDKLTYAGNRASLAPVWNESRFEFQEIDICDARRVADILRKSKPQAIIHLAAESHVDRSIDGPAAFIETNIIGTYTLLEEARSYWESSQGDIRSAFRFHHVSTDEVYGDLNEGVRSDEATPYAPNSPYSASKAASDHLVRAWATTYGLPVLVTNCSNNYGPYQFPEKLIPHMILLALKGKPLPVYGDGQNVRDWLYVDDHVSALYQVLTRGRVGETYNIGGDTERMNVDVVRMICQTLDELVSSKPEGINSFQELITFVKDRPGHDRRYAMDASKLQRELGWRPKNDFANGIRKTIDWYLSHREWWTGIVDGSYRLERIGSGAATQ